MMFPYSLIVVFIFGTLIGSFLNVLIYRMPRGESWVGGRSKCPACEKIIFWYENIPLISFIFLRGRCSSCKTFISWKYPLVELIAGICFVFFFPSDYWIPEVFLRYIFYMSIICVFLVHFFIDLEFQILPDALTLYLAAIFLSYSLIYHAWLHWLLGAFLGFFIPWSVTWIFYHVRKKVGLGGGDIKLFATLGLYLGPLGIIHNIFLSCLLGSVVGITLISFKKMSKDQPLSFGPCIITVAFLQIFFPDLFSFLNGFGR